jgi:hypothetical protein
VFKVLNFVEIGGPMDASMAHSTPANQRDGVAQAFTAICEVPNPSIVAAVEMTTGAAQVAVPIHPSVFGVIENLFAEQDLRGQ